MGESNKLSIKLKSEKNTSIEELPQKIEDIVEKSFRHNHNKKSSIIKDFKEGGLRIFFADIAKLRNTDKRLDGFDYNKLSNTVNNSVERLFMEEKKCAESYIDENSEITELMFTDIQEAIWRNDEIRPKISKLDLYILFDEKELAIKRIKDEGKLLPYDNLDDLKKKLEQMQKEISVIKDKNLKKRNREKKKPINILIAIVLLKVLSSILTYFVPAPENTVNVSRDIWSSVFGAFSNAFSKVMDSIGMLFNTINTIFSIIFALVLGGLIIFLAVRGFISVYKGIMQRIDNKYDAILSKDLSKCVNKKFKEIEEMEEEILEAFRGHIDDIALLTENGYKSYIKESLNTVITRER